MKIFVLKQNTWLGLKKIGVMVVVTNYKLAELQLGDYSAMSNEALP